MSIEFKQQEIESKEKQMKHLYAGYFSPDGALIDYNRDDGEENRHNEWTKQPSKTFLEYMSYLVDGKDFVHRGHDILFKEENEDYETFKRSIDNKIKEYESRSYSELNEDEKFNFDILRFFQNAYAHDDFFACINKTYTMESPSEIERKVRCKYRECNKEYQDDKINRQIKKQMLQGFKDICVQYIGYDSLERIGPKAKTIEINDPGYKFICNPRVITTSHRNINDRFYNYLLMDWEVNKVPGYKYNPDTGLYEEKKGIIVHYSGEDEDILHDEIESIKRLVPINDRYKYFKK